MFKFIFIFLIKCFAEDVNEVFLPLGGTTNIEVLSGQTIHVNRPHIIHIEDRGRFLNVVALKEGEVFLTSGLKRYHIKVIKPESFKLYGKFNSATKDMLGPEVNIKEGQIILRGRLLRLSDWIKFSEIQSQQGTNYQAHFEIDPEVRKQITSYFKDLTSKQNIPEVSWLWGQPITAAISEELKSHEEIYTAILEKFGIKIHFAPTEVNIKPLIRVHIIVAEVSRKIEKQIGVHWPDTYSAQLSPKWQSPKELSLFLKALEEKGLGQVLASPTLIARSGSEAQFLAGGEFPIRVISSRMREVIWKRHGIFLEIKPQADHAKRMSIALTTEVSMIDSGQSVDGIPGLKTNRMSSHLDLESSRTIMLSGLVRNEWFESERGLPGLSNLPILGHLFKSREFLNHKSELIIFVTPEIVETTNER